MGIYPVGRGFMAAKGNSHHRLREECGSDEWAAHSSLTAQQKE